MKKLIAIFLLLVYSFTAYGITISRHFCRGNEKDTTFVNFSHLAKCCCAETGMPDDCCNDELKKADTDDHNATAKILFDSQPQLDLLEQHFSRLQFFLFPNKPDKKSWPALENSPPYSLPLFLLLRDFRI